jgi:hypothetical protein
MIARVVKPSSGAGAQNERHVARAVVDGRFARVFEAIVGDGSSVGGDEFGRAGRSRPT